jgi:hypothetical protein
MSVPPDPPLPPEPAPSPASSLQAAKLETRQPIAMPPNPIRRLENMAPSMIGSPALA